MAEITLPSGKKIGYHWTGKSNSSTIILLNGSIFNYHQFDVVYLPKLLKYLPKDKYSILQYDYTGVGKSSDYDGEFDFLELTEELVELMNALNIKKAHLFGVSKGALIGQFLAALHPDRISSLAGYGNPNLANDDKREMLVVEYRRRYESVQSLKGIHEERVDERNFEIVYDTVYVPAIFRKQVYQLGIVEKLTNLWARRKIKKMLKGTQISFMDKLFAYYLRDITEDERERYVNGLKNLELPVLFIHGSKDEIIPVSSSELLHEWVPKSELVIIEGLSHSRPSVIGRYGDKVIKHYVEFINDLDNY